MNELYIKYIGNSALSRCEALGLYIIDNNATVRSAAKVFGISKSTVHKDDGVIIGTVKGNAKKH
ncbi:MAG: sporulation transcriptional regulator SpoIIID [Oscillospiraceae bacterium]|nr:sporulation transcriptional regulator SpoIIID [Oscillospiraceae bacterium]